ncbi:glycerophosphodiester phosphodiesterase family protein [Planctomycetaceae bacterium SH139]
MFRKVLTNLSACGSNLVVSDLLFKATSVLLLTPIVSLLFRLFLYVSGRDVLADVDIARFLLHPLGVLAFITVGGAVLCVFVLEQAMLMTICLAAEQEKEVAPRQALLFVMTKGAGLLRLTSRVVARLGMIALPFLFGGGAIFWLLLTERDINFYLTRKPPVFWIAGLLIGGLLMGLAALLLRRLAGWVFASPLLVFEGYAPVAAMKESEHRAAGKRSAILRRFVWWAVINISLAFALNFATVKLCQNLVSIGGFSLWALTISVGSAMALAALVNFSVSMLANASCASLLGITYAAVSKPATFRLPEPMATDSSWKLPELTRFRIVVISLAGLLLAGVIGGLAIRSIELKDQVQITAHRGGAGVAPENTLAAIRYAIRDGADWIEIDVQESSDGVVIVAHDSDLAKVAGNPVKIWAATAEELRKVDIGSYFDERFRDERIPTLDEVLRLCKGKVGVNIELKYYGHTQDLENRVIEMVEQYDMGSEIVIMSLQMDGIEKVKSRRPEWTVGLLTAVSVGDLTRAKADFLAVSSKLATRRFVRTSHGRQKTVSAWTVNDAYTMSAMVSRGVDNLITDYPALAREVLAEREAMSPLERLMVELAFFLGVTPAANGQ